KIKKYVQISCSKTQKSLDYRSVPGIKGQYRKIIRFHTGGSNAALIRQLCGPYAVKIPYRDQKSFFVTQIVPLSHIAQFYFGNRHIYGIHIIYRSPEHINICLRISVLFGHYLQRHRSFKNVPDLVKRKKKLFFI